MFALRPHVRRASSTTGLNVLFLGSNSIAIPALNALVASRQGLGRFPGLVRNLELVCPAPKTYRGKLRGVPTRDIALQQNLVVHDVPAELGNLKTWSPSFFKDGQYDIGVVASFGFILRPPQLEHLRLGAVNIHPSLLPKYRGPCPLDHTILNGDTETGVSLIDLSPEVDSGALLAQKTAPTLADDTVETLGARLGALGADMLLDVLSDFDHVRAKASKQVESLVSHAPKLSLESANVRWECMTRVRLYNECRARLGRTWLQTTLQEPRTPVTIRGIAQPDPAVRGGPPPVRAGARHDSPASASGAASHQMYTCGDLYYDAGSRRLWVKCLDSWAQIIDISVPTKKSYSIESFANAYHISELGSRFVFDEAA